MRDYQRVLPRDLFNEAKLLKGLGQLALLTHEGIDGGHWPLHLHHDCSPQKGFAIQLDDLYGNLIATNLELYCGGTIIPIGSTYNSKRFYPLKYQTKDMQEEFVLTEEGRFSSEFKAYLNQLCHSRQAQD